MTARRVASSSMGGRIADLSLAARLVRGSGPVDAIRVLMMALGIGLSVGALLLAVTVPRALGASSAREASRIPVLTDRSPLTTPFTVDTSPTVVGDRHWTRMQLRGGDTRSPLPPGLGRLPEPGHSVVSPALRDLLARDASKRLGLGVIDDAPLDDVGLARPDELVSYTRVASRPRPSSGVSPPSTGSPTRASRAGAGSLSRARADPSADEPGPDLTVVSFGDDSMSGGTSVALGIEAMLLVAIPAVLFLGVCARLSVTSRRRRLGSLRLIGVSTERCARIFGSELALVSVLGAGVGVLLFTLAQPWLAGGMLGMTWFTQDTRVPPAAAGVCLIAPLLAAVLGRRRMHRLLVQGPSRPFEARHRNATLPVGSLLALPSGAFLAVVAAKALVAGPDDPVLPVATHVILVLTASLCSLTGLLLIVPRVSARIAHWLSSTNVPAGIRLGARMAATGHERGQRIVSALLATLTVGGLSSAFLYSTYLDAVGDPRTATLNVDVSHTPVAQRERLRAALPRDTHILVIGTTDASGRDVTINVTTCEVLARFYLAPQVRCPHSAVRTGPATGPDAVPAGARLRVAQVGGKATTVVAPAPVVDGLNGGELVVPPDLAPWALKVPNPLITVVVPQDEVEALQARLQADAPEAVVEHVIKDPSSLARRDEQVAVLRPAVAVAYLLCLLTFVFSMFENRWDSERTLVALRAMGVPASVTRQAAAVQGVLPVAIAVLLVVPAVVASGVAFLAFWGAGNARDPSLWLPLVAEAGGALVLTYAAGWLLGRGRLDLAALTDPH